MTSETQHVTIRLTIQDRDGYSTDMRVDDTITLNIANREKGGKATATVAVLLYDSVQVLYDIALAERNAVRADVDSDA